MAFTMKGIENFGEGTPLFNKKGKQKQVEEKDKKIAGESTGPISKNEKGEEYAIFGAGDKDFDNYAGNVGVNPGDTIFATTKHTIGGGDPSWGDKYIMGGDHNVKETESSKTRKTGPKSFKIEDYL